MSITMTIEVSPEQAVRIAEILAKPAAPVQTTNPPPVQALEIPQPPAHEPVPVQPAVPTVPVQTATPTSAPAPNPAPIPVQQPTAPAPVPTSVRQYTPDELSIASRPIVEAGRQQELLDLLHSFTYTDTSGVVRNVQSIRDMPKELYPAFANGIRQLGGKI